MSGIHIDLGNVHEQFVSDHLMEFGHEGQGEDDVNLLSDQKKILF